MPAVLFCPSPAPHLDHIMTEGTLQHRQPTWFSTGAATGGHAAPKTRPCQKTIAERPKNNCRRGLRSARQGAVHVHEGCQQMGQSVRKTCSHAMTAKHVHTAKTKRRPIPSVSPTGADGPRASGNNGINPRLLTPQRNHGCKRKGLGREERDSCWAFRGKGWGIGSSRRHPTPSIDRSINLPRHCAPVLPAFWGA